MAELTKTLLAIVAVVAFCVVLSSAVLVLRNQGICGTPYLPQPTPNPTPTEAATIIEPLAAGYLDDTKIYFVSAKYSYGVYPEDLMQQYTNVTVIRKGDPCLFLNLTLRNDYTDNDTFPLRWGDTKLNHGFGYMMLDVSFYDASGSELNTTNITHASVPFPNRDSFSIKNGEAETLEWVFSIPHTKIARFNLTINYLGPLPVP